MKISDAKRVSAIAAAVWTMMALITVGQVHAQRYMEKLNRGLIAVPSGNGYYLSWRLFGTDPQDNTFGFNVYKGATKLNATVTTNATCYQDNSAGTGTYTVRPVTNGVEGAASESARFLAQNYLSIPLQPPAGGTTPDGVAYTYSANDASVGDVDGDGEYEIILKWDPSNSKDNSQSGFTGDVFLDAYKLNGARLWRIDLGINIRAGAHYTQFVVYDLDGDGCAEVACKTAPGTKDGTGNFLKTGPSAGANNTADYRTYTAGNSYGTIMQGPEWYTIFNGKTGAELVTTNYKPPRYGTLTPTPAQLNAEWGDNYGNREDRYLAGVAYLDGVHPSIVACRGYYTRSTLWAFDWRSGKLTERWYFDTDSSGTGKDGKPLSAFRTQGCHSLRVGDVDGDGFDEVVYGACTIDHDGKGLYSTGLEHGDALHLSVMDPDRGGLQVWQVHEDETTNGGIAASFRDAKTGTIIWSDAGTADNGRGCCGPLIADTRGWQMWSGVGGLWNTAHTKVGNSPGSDNFTMWWDGSLNRATEDGTSITAYSGATLLTTAGCASNNGTKSTPCLTADIFGDWREEVVYRTTNSDTLRIYTTTTPTTNRLYTLMHDPIYRMSVCSENTAYNQPPEPGIYIGYGMTLPETKPNIRTDLPTTVVGSTLPMPASFLRADICLKVMGDQSFLLPHAIAGAARTVAIYDCSGKLVRKVTTGKEVVNLKKDFGISTGIFVVRARAKEKS